MEEYQLGKELLHTLSVVQLIWENNIQYVIKNLKYN